MSVVTGGIYRNGEIWLTPVSGYWTICFREPNKFDPGVVFPFCIPPTLKLGKVGVFVDYEEGMITFNDVDYEAHRNSFTGNSFTD